MLSAAYGEAASVALDLAMKPIPKLCALVAYYPGNVPIPGTRFPTSLNVVVHLAGLQRKMPSCRYHSYLDVEPGFAEENLDHYDKVSASLAWSRSLAVLRKGFQIEVDLEKIWDDHVARESSCLGKFGSKELTLESVEFVTKDADATMSTMVAQPYVNHVPTMTGGIGYKDLHRFYRDYFIPGNPPSLKMKLLSRTVGTDRVVDELYMSFEHTQVMPWLLPDVDPSNKHVDVALVVIVCIRGGKLFHEHIYWDQASVLVQIGLLDPKLASDGKAQGRLPVVDGAGARKVVDESSISSNELISSWRLSE